jgi:hypothetical protein
MDTLEIAQHGTCGKRAATLRHGPRADARQIKRKYLILFIFLFCVA